jgi:hypothetical protein
MSPVLLCQMSLVKKKGHITLTGFNWKRQKWTASSSVRPPLFPTPD